MKSQAFATLTLLTVLAPGTAHAWGSYGHQQVNSAALRILELQAAGESGEFARCALANRDLLVRLAVTPDVDWKMASPDRNLMWTLHDLEKALAGNTESKVISRLKRFARNELQKKFKLAPPALLEALASDPTHAETLRAVKNAIARTRDASSADALLAKLENRNRISSIEQPLHFYEADAFAAEPEPAAILDLPAFPAYLVNLDLFRPLLSANAARVDRMSPKKKFADPASPTDLEIARHGTAPWRTLQLYDLAVEALGRGDVDGALFHLGIMGHYVGDMSQPFHGTLDYDGGAYSSMAEGIHTLFEDEILVVTAEDAGVKQDRRTKLWSGFAPTEPRVLARAEARGDSTGPLTPVRRDGIPAEVVKLVAETFPMGTPLLERFAATRTELGVTEYASFGPKKPSMEVIEALARRFLTMQIGDSESQLSVLEAAEERIAASAVLLARLWSSAYAEAGSPKLEGCGSVAAFDPDLALEKYPMPAYLP